MRQSTLLRAGIAAAAAVSLIATAGCSGTPVTSSSGKPSETTSTDSGLSGKVVVANLSGNAGWIERSAEAFKKLHPDVEVELNVQEYASLTGSAAQIYSSSNAPDIGFLQPGVAAFPTLAKSGALLDLSDVWVSTGLAGVAPSGAQDQWTHDGGTYGISTNQVWAPVIYYNKDLFRQAGIGEVDGRVASFDQWDEIVTKLNAIDVAPLSIAGGGNSALHIVCGLLQALATEEQYQDFLVNMQPGSTVEANYTSGPFLEALKKITEWVDNGVFVNGAAGLNSSQAQSLFASGGAAMLSDGSWAPDSLVKADVQFDYGWFLYPSGVSESKFGTFTGDGLVVPATSKNPEAAKAFLAFLMGPEGQALLGATTPIRTDMDPAGLTDLAPSTADQLVGMATLGSVPIWSPTANVTTIILETVPQLLLGSLPAEDAAVRIQSAVDESRAAA